MECEAGKISVDGADECDFCEIGKWAKKEQFVEIVQRSI